MRIVYLRDIYVYTATVVWVRFNSMYAVYYPLGCWLFVAAEFGEFGFTCHTMKERALHKYLVA